MSELRRWSEEGATPDEALLVEVSRRERAPAQTRVRTLEALGVAVAASAATAGAATAGTAAAAPHIVVKAGFSALAKLAALSVVGGGIVAGAIVVAQRPHVGPTMQEPAPAAPGAGRPSSVEPPPQVPAVTDVSDPAPAETAVGNAARSDRATRPHTSDDLARELAALESVQEALAQRDAATSLRLLDRYQARFPHGALSSEATVLRVQALLASGDRGRAQALVEGYCAAHPSSPYAKRLRELVRGG